MAPRKQTPESNAPQVSIARLRIRVVLVLVVLAALAYLGNQAWQRHLPSLIDHPEYAITPEKIHLPPAPPWIPANLRVEVLRDATLEGPLSLLDDGTSLERLKGAFEFHPWVESVERVSKRLPAGIDIELVYREPVAAVETVGPRRMELLIVDRNGTRLPEHDLSEAERRYLPRITGVVEQPQIGQLWTDPRVALGIRLATGLRDVWQTLRLVEIIPQQNTPVPEQPGSISFHVLTSGGTRIVWGNAPGEESPGESPFAVKLQQLQSYDAQFGDLSSIYGPKQLDLRRGLQIYPREAKKPDGEGKLSRGEADRAENDDPLPEEDVASREDAESTTR